MVTNLPFLRWLVAHPAVRAGRDDDGVPRRAPAALRAAGAALPPPWRGSFRLNLPAPPPHAPPDEDAASHAHGPGARAEHRSTAPMPGTVIRVLVAEGDRVAAAPAAGRARGDEDGDAARLALRGASCEASTSPRATGSPAAPSSSSSRSRLETLRQALFVAQKSFCSFIAAPMSPLIFSLPDM